MNSWPSRRGFPVVLLALAALFALSRAAQAVTPAPDGGYPNQNTAEGLNALFSLTTGGYNTANGYNALFSTTSGGSNTATGASALNKNGQRQLGLAETSLKREGLD
jgi:hypothetical protein